MARHPEGPATRQDASTWVAVANVAAKALLVLLMIKVAMDPAWGHLEGKAPLARAVIYPLLAFVMPVAVLLHRHLGRARDPSARRPYPWLADLLLTLPGFSDVLGNRLDLYDSVVWFDDMIHFVNTGLVSAAVVVLCGLTGAPVLRRLEVAVAAGVSLALAWELWEYFAFVTRSREATTAYVDTIGDLSLGWLGAFAAGLVVGVHPPRRGLLLPLQRAADDQVPAGGDAFDRV